MMDHEDTPNVEGIHGDVEGWGVSNKTAEKAEESDRTDTKDGRWGLDEGIKEYCANGGCTSQRM